MQSIERFCRQHFQNKEDQLRIGQRFVVHYINGPWPALYYEPNEDKAVSMISKWLKDHQYIDDLPIKIRN